ncbi:MAG: hypothetical protein ABS99_05330 [Acetobacteraceae bacterium SCN 69-10]|nr:DUF2075 domain-containing protein [Rhodospirillales bacterium]ODU56992.1 MAG: hypothetical protein ABS99_05330 [Acetobacteraceae bacterium SCN 69-10]OJY76875.1 MAG: hypothetical protein BGP12_05350 [Rhodospirillales bacterium 70-18]
MISLRVGAFLAADAQTLVARLAFEDAQRFRGNEPRQLRAWADTLDTLRAALADWPETADWRLLLEYDIHRLGRRIDAVLVTPRGVLVLEFKAGAEAFLAQDRAQAEDYAIDLQDFHSACRRHPIVPVLVATRAQPGPMAWPLLLVGATTVLDASAATLPALLRDLWRHLPQGEPLDVAAWEHAPYRPVPGIIDAACTLYTHHGVADIAAARADANNLTATTDAILAAISSARTDQRHTILFVTGIPGAGKTLCGLNAVFGSGRDAGATFLTGNPALVHVLREALARDAAAGARGRMRAARQRTKAAIQALPAFRDHYVGSGDVPAERVAVIDEAQRAWSAVHAISKGRDREVKLHDSEPGHLLDIMGRHPDWAVIVCLIGNGQEIHTGEGGLAEWGTALQARPAWRVLAAPGMLDPGLLGRAADPRQRLPALPGLQTHDSLHLDVPVRSIRNPHAAAWVDAVLAGDQPAAAAIARAHGPLPFLLTRDLAALRRHLRATCRGLRRAGLLASSGARRLRADGLGAELPHMEADAVAHWFLDRWPADVRASDALDTVATEFSCQGLELDHVGLCWGGDMVRVSGHAEWRPRTFIGTNWQTRHAPEAAANRRNTYRVLLTRARYETVIWVPQGDPADRTRAPAEFAAVTAFLTACGIEALNETQAAPAIPSPQPALL